MECGRATRYRYGESVMKVWSFCAVRSRHALLLAGALLEATSVSHAQEVAFGTRTLKIPNPEGFEPLAALSPRYMQAAQAYLPATNRLVEAYATAADAQALGRGEGATLARYFQLQAPRKADGLPVSESDFIDAGKEIEGGLEKTLKNSDELTTKLTSQGNAEVKRMTTTDPKVALSGVSYLGVFRREPWGLFFSIKSGVSAGGANQTLVCGGALVLVNYQLLFLYSYSQYHDEDDRRWVEQATSSWADAVRAANPNDPAVAAKASHGLGAGVLRNTLLGAIIGGLIGLVVAVVRKRRS